MTTKKTRLDNKTRVLIMRFMLPRLFDPKLVSAETGAMNKFTERLVSDFKKFVSTNSKDLAALSRWGVKMELSSITTGNDLHSWPEIADKHEGKTFVLVDCPPCVLDPNTRKARDCTTPTADMEFAKGFRDAGSIARGQINTSYYRNKAGPWMVQVAAKNAPHMLPVDTCHGHGFLRVSFKRDKTPHAVEGKLTITSPWLSVSGQTALKHYFVQNARSFAARKALVDALRTLLIESKSFEDLVARYPEAADAYDEVFGPPDPITEPLPPPQLATNTLNKNSKARKAAAG